MRRARRDLNPLTTLGLEFAPLLVFFVVNRHGGIFVATGTFIAATMVAVLAMIVASGRASPILCFNAAMITVFGGLTLFLRDDIFIKIKPTVDYAMFGAVLLFGLMTGRLFIRSALGITFPGLSERAWRLMTRNWAFFFLAMAAANEFVWRMVSTDAWVTYRVWVPTFATLLFGLAHVPFLLSCDAQGEDLHE